MTPQSFRAALQDTVERWPRVALPLRAILQRLQDREEPEMRLLPWLVPRSGLSVDVGANRGIYTWQLAKLSEKVLAVEANAAYVPFLRRVSPRNVRVVHTALSDEAGEARLRIPDVGRHSGGLGTIETENPVTGSAQSLPVPRQRLDEVVGDDVVSFIKVDVEGHELAVLRGAERILDRDRPTLLVEAENRHRANAVQTLVDYLEPRGYTGWMLIDGIVGPISRFDSQVHQATAIDHVALDQGHRPVDYINNFIFIAK